MIPFEDKNMYAELVLMFAESLKRFETMRNFLYSYELSEREQKCITNVENLFFWFKMKTVRMSQNYLIVQVSRFIRFLLLCKFLMYFFFLKFSIVQCTKFINSIFFFT